MRQAPVPNNADNKPAIVSAANSKGIRQTDINLFAGSGIFYLRSVLILKNLF